MVKSKFQVLLVPNWRAFRITVIYVNKIDDKFDTKLRRPYGVILLTNRPGREIGMLNFYAKVKSRKRDSWVNSWHESQESSPHAI